MNLSEPEAPLRLFATILAGFSPPKVGAREDAAGIAAACKVRESHDIPSTDCAYDSVSRTQISFQVTRAYLQRKSRNSGE